MIDRDRRLLLSLKPRYAEAILLGEKTVELRRTRLLVTLPTDALIYASSPVMALVGRCRVDTVHSLGIDRLWRMYGRDAAITRKEFLNYFDGTPRGYALLLSSPERLSSAVSLADIRASWNGFQPPQSFRYLTFPRSDELLALAG